jgi:S-formylglutathione hydrolase FrmB
MPVHNFERPRGRVEEIVIESDALRGNGLGDPCARTVAVYLPEGYDHSDADYPLFVDLAAFTSSGLKRLGWTAFGESVPQRLDRLIARGAMGPVVLACPDAFTSLGGNQYVDSPILGRWETFVAQELVPALEARFRVRRHPSQRAVYGKSSGGYGALVQGMRHAERWGAIACHSGDMGFEWVYLRDFPTVLDALAREDGDVERFVRKFAENPKVRGDQLHVLMILAMAASYAPDLEAPLGVRLPVDPHTCEIDPRGWARWLEHDPVRMVDDTRCRESLASLRGVFFDCGRRDQYLLHYGARTLARKLTSYGLAHVYDEFDDDHSSIDYRLDVSLPWLYSTLAG